MADALVDTGVFLGFLSRADRRHEAAARALRAARGRLLTSWAVVTETIYMIGLHEARAEFLESIAKGAVDLPPLSAPDAESLAWYFRKYRNLEPDLADLSLLVLADLTGTMTILTFDRDFLLYRTRSGRSPSCPLLD